MVYPYKNVSINVSNWSKKKSQKNKTENIKFPWWANHVIVLFLRNFNDTKTDF